MFILEPLDNERTLRILKTSKKPVRLFSIQLGYESQQLAKQFAYHVKVDASTYRDRITMV